MAVKCRDYYDVLAESIKPFRQLMRIGTINATSAGAAGVEAVRPPP